jgi:hypothetical protein
LTGPDPGAAVLTVCRGLAHVLTGEELAAEQAGAWALERVPAAHHALVAAALDGATELDPQALRRFRTFAVGAAVRRRPGRKVAGLP